MDRDNYIYAYYQQIKNGSVIVNRWISAIYEYLIAGIESAAFYFDQRKANAAVEWIEAHCFHTEGPLAPGPLKLELWQKAMISAIYGIVNKDGLRQFSEILLVIARKNGKSLLASAIGKYTFCIEGGYGAKVYCIAPKLDQASIVYNNLWQMVTIDPEYIEEKERLDEKDEHNKRLHDDSGLPRHRQSELAIPATKKKATGLTRRCVYAMKSPRGRATRASNSMRL